MELNQPAHFPTMLALFGPSFPGSNILDNDVQPLVCAQGNCFPKRRAGNGPNAAQVPLMDLMMSSGRHTCLEPKVMAARSGVDGECLKIHWVVCGARMFRPCHSFAGGNVMLG